MDYTLIFKNNSNLSGAACVYQDDPDLTAQGFMRLAWFAKEAHPHTNLNFNWKIDYCFVWAETGTLAPGVQFLASETTPADLSTSNKITLDYVSGAFEFTNQGQGASPGNLYINESVNIPPNNQASVGVGMSGFGTFAAQAGPNLNAIYTPHPTYFITFGTYTQGEVMDATISTVSAEIDFPPNTYSMTAILNANNTWTIIPTAQVNSKHVEAKKYSQKAVWGVF